MLLQVGFKAMHKFDINAKGNKQYLVFFMSI